VGRASSDGHGALAIFNVVGPLGLPRSSHIAALIVGSLVAHIALPLRLNEQVAWA
jgi:hypothetical protein